MKSRNDLTKCILEILSCGIKENCYWLDLLCFGSMVFWLSFMVLCMHKCVRRKCFIITAKKTCSWHQLILCWRSHHFSAAMFLFEHKPFLLNFYFLPTPPLSTAPSLERSAPLAHVCLDLRWKGGPVVSSQQPISIKPSPSPSPSVPWERGITD